MTPVAKSKVAQQEHLAVELAKRYNEGNVTTVITQDRLDAVICECPLKRHRKKDKDETDPEFQRQYAVFNTQHENDEFAKQFGAQRKCAYKPNESGFKMCSTTSLGVHSLEEIERFAKESSGCSNLDKPEKGIKVGECAYRRYVCYRDIQDINTECYVTIWAKRLREPK
jgi:hypothetical protein